jgi:hypothetical protein
MAIDLGSVIGNVYTGIVETLTSRAGVLISDGQDLAAVLLLVTLSWAVVIWLISGDGAQALADTFSSVTRFAVVSLMLTGWLAVVGAFLQRNTNDISQKLAGTSSIPQSVDLIANAAMRLLENGRKNDSPGASAPSWKDILITLPQVLLTMLLKLLTLGFMTLMLAAYLTVIFMAEVLFGIGMSLGPILVPWLIWQRMEWLFDGWLKFILAACFTKIIAALMVATVSSVIVGAKLLSENIKVENGVDLIGVDELAAFLMCVVAAIGTFMMWQVPGIAQGLLSGSLGATPKSFGRNAASQAITGGVKGATKALFKGEKK